MYCESQTKSVEFYGVDRQIRTKNKTTKKKNKYKKLHRSFFLYEMLVRISLQSSLTLPKWAFRRCQDLDSQTSPEASELANLRACKYVHMFVCINVDHYYGFGQRRIIKTKAYKLTKRSRC